MVLVVMVLMVMVVVFLVVVVVLVMIMGLVVVISQLFQSPSLVRDPDQTNHTQNVQQGEKVELGLQLQLFPEYIYLEID